MSVHRIGVRPPEQYTGFCRPCNKPRVIDFSGICLVCHQPRTADVDDDCYLCCGEGVIGGLVIDEDSPSVDQVCGACRGSGRVGS